MSHGSRGTDLTNRLHILVVVPTYNEIENLPEFVRRIRNINVDSLGLVIVDDNSPDGTGILAEEYSQKYPKFVSVVHRPIRSGLKSAYRCGFKFALKTGADIVIQMDCDLSHAPEDIPLLILGLENADVSVGSRYTKGGGSDRTRGFSRRCLSYWGNVYIRWVGGVKIYDATSGFKAFGRRVLESIDLGSLKCSGFGFQAEFIRACQKSGFLVVEQPIIFIDRKFGSSKMSLGIIWEALWRFPLFRMQSVKINLSNWLTNLT